jgi:uncharacterized protein (DUF697 family)
VAAWRGASLAKLTPLGVWAVAKELREAARDRDAIVVAGAPALADVLRRELGRAAKPGVVREGSLAGAAALVYVLAAEPTDEDRRALADARRQRVPIVAVLADPSLDDAVPHVLATDVVRVAPGSGFPLDEIARVLARRMGDAGTTVAARVPALRPAVCEELIARVSRTNGMLGAAIFVPGADLPVLTLNQLRLVLRIGLAHGYEVERERLPEVLAVVGSGLGFRALARRLLGTVPVAGWAVKAGVAYAGTRAVGEAAVKYFEARAQSDRPAAQPNRPPATPGPERSAGASRTDMEEDVKGEPRLRGCSRGWEQRTALGGDGGSD